MNFFSSLLDRLLIPLIAIFFIFSFVFNYFISGEQQFSYLSQSFLQGQTHFIQEPATWADASLYRGKYYWPLGPFPSIFLMPFTYIFNILGIFFRQGFANFFLVLLVFFVVKKLASYYKYSEKESNYWAFVFCFGSTFLAVNLMPWSWYFAQVITVALLFLSFLIFETKRNYLLVGLAYAALVATRVTAALSLVFFLLVIFKEAKKTKDRLTKAILLLLPVVTTLVLLGIYNYVRFGSLVEQGYSYQLLIEPLVKAREYGIFNLIHIPGNLYYFLFSIPEPVFRDGISHVLAFPFIKANSWGMSLFVTTPILFYMFFIRYQSKYAKYMLAAVAVVALVILTYYGIGYRQYGYRYSLDFLPLIFILFMKNYKDKYRTLNVEFKSLAIISAIWNLFLFLTFLIIPY